MNLDILIKLSLGAPITRQDLESAYADLCDRLHSGDCESCPVYKALDGKINPDGSHRSGCLAFKDGGKMLDEIHISQRGLCDEFETEREAIDFLAKKLDVRLNDDGIEDRTFNPVARAYADAEQVIHRIAWFSRIGIKDKARAAYWRLFIRTIRSALDILEMSTNEIRGDKN